MDEQNEKANTPRLRPAGTAVADERRPPEEIRPSADSSAGPPAGAGSDSGRRTGRGGGPNSARTAQRPAWILGLGGLVPFVLMAGAFAYAGREFIAYGALLTAFTGYSATILAFLGGIRWGVGLIPGAHRTRILILSVLPSLLGWVLLFVPAPWVFAGFAVGFLLQGVWDQLATRNGGLPGWFGRLRLVLTAGVVVCQAVAFFATF